MAASLLGLFGAADGAGAVTTGSRTTTSGSLITVACGAYAVTAVSTPTDNKSNTYGAGGSGTGAEQFDVSCKTGTDAQVNGSYNIGGTRGATHTVSKADDGSNSIGGQEWDGIEASPTVASGTTADTTSTSPSASATVSAASLCVLVFGYADASTTFEETGADGTIAQEIDEDSTNQAVCVRYKVAQTGTPSITGALAASRSWGAGLMAFTESAGGGGGFAASTQSFPMLGVQ